MWAVSALVPLAFAALHAGNVPDAAHDEGTVRVVGLGWTGGFRALDALVAAPLQMLPIGTRSARAVLASALATAVAGAVLYRLARNLSRARPVGRERAFPLVVAAVASLTATLSFAWQAEATCVAGSTIGALLAIAPVALAVEAQEGSVHTAAVVFALGLALAYEPLVGATAVAGVLPEWIGARARKAGPAPRGVLLIAALLGVATVALAIAERHSALSTLAPAFASPVGEGDAGVGLVAFLHAQVGWVGLAAAALGAGLSLWEGSSRARAASILSVAAVGLASTRAGAPFGGARTGAPVLAAIGGIRILASVAMDRAVRAVAEARLPLASASASMIVLLELTFPALSADDASQRLDAHGPPAGAVWSEVALGPLPPRPIVLVRAPRLLTRLLAARSSGELRPDVAVIPLGNIVGPLAARELTLEPKLVPLWRDLLLTLAPDEWALSSLAGTRALALPFDPRWERSMVRHLVPVGLFGAFEPEPRGMSDCARALDGFVADRDRLTSAMGLPGVAPEISARKPTRRDPSDAYRLSVLARITADSAFSIVR